MKILSKKIVSQDEKWIRYETKYKDGSVVVSLQLTDEHHKKVCWFLDDPSEIFEDHLSLPHADEISHAKWFDIQNMFDENWVRANGDPEYDMLKCPLPYPSGDSGIAYIYYASMGRDIRVIVNWLLGPIAEVLSESEIEVRNMHWLYRIGDISNFYEKIYMNEKFIKSKAKDAIVDLSFKSIEEILATEEYFKSGDGIEQALVEKIVAANQEKIDKDGFDKVLNWLVGQVMKESRGKADPAEVKSILNGMQ